MTIVMMCVTCRPAQAVIGPGWIHNQASGTDMCPICAGTERDLQEAMKQEMKDKQNPEQGEVKS